ncbi:lipoyl synthase [Nitrospirota bacterium]
MISERLPLWLRQPHDYSIHRTVKTRLRKRRLKTVCEEARCPNRTRCFSKPTATYMILGATCTRGCGFCAVDHGTPEKINTIEPEMIAEAAREMNLKHVVVTSVTRDDLPDGGAEQFARTILAIRASLHEASVEVLIPDFGGNMNALETVLGARPDVLNHNIETVPSLYKTVRPLANYNRSLLLLKRAGEHEVVLKSGLMLGFGESYDEVLSVLSNLREVGCDLLTIGQYMRPGRTNIAVKEYVLPEVFESLSKDALDMGFRFVLSDPLARSSMNAQEAYRSINGREQV